MGKKPAYQSPKVSRLDEEESVYGGEPGGPRCATGSGAAGTCFENGNAALGPCAETGNDPGFKQEEVEE